MYDFQIKHREKYDVVLPFWCNLYLLAHFGVVVYGFQELAIRHMVSKYFKCKHFMLILSWIPFNNYSRNSLKTPTFNQLFLRWKFMQTTVDSHRRKFTLYKNIRQGWRFIEEPTKSESTYIHKKHKVRSTYKVELCTQRRLNI